MKRQPLVSILIPTYNRHALLVDTLKGVLIQKYEPLEILVYDQSSDHPAEVNTFLEKHSQKIRLIKGIPKGLVSAYRRCAALSRGELCLFVDDDVLITDDNLVGTHVRHYRNERIGAVSGQVFHEGQTRPRPIDQRVRGKFGWMFVRFDVAERMDDLPSLCGANMSFRKQIYEQVGGFDINYKQSGFRFETDFTFAVKKAGYRVIFDPEAALVHRYGQAGGAGNRHLYSMQAAAHEWYVDFFGNTWYFLQKWYDFPIAVKLMIPVWREHVFNRSTLKMGPGFIIKRHAAFLHGLLLGQQRKTFGL